MWVMVPFVPVEKRAGYDLRLLKPHAVAVTEYQNRGDGYARLGSYLSGENEEKIKFPESQPIVMTYQGDSLERKTMQVYLSSENGSPPLPKNQGIYLDVAGGEIVAAKRFEGNATQEVCKRMVMELMDSLRAGVFYVWCSIYDVLCVLDVLFISC